MTLTQSSDLSGSVLTYRIRPDETVASPRVDAMERPTWIAWDHTRSFGTESLELFGKTISISVGSATRAYEFTALERLPDELDEALVDALRIGPHA
jgi:hypothetical protein